MKRDMDLIRALLLKLESWPITPFGTIILINPDDEEVAVEGYDVDQIHYHLSQLVSAGLIDTGASSPMYGIQFRCLSPAGHDFLDSVRNEEIWATTKKGATAAGGFTIDLLKDPIAPLR